MAHDVFISYSSKDKKAAEAVCAKLESDGIKCWIAPRDIPPSAKYAQTITGAIDESLLVILIFSSNSNVSNHVESEINIAFDKNKSILPFRVENTPLSNALTYYLSSAHWFDASVPPLDKHLQKLLGDVRRLLKKDENVADASTEQPQELPSALVTLQSQSKRAYWQKLFNTITLIKVTIGFFGLMLVFSLLYFFSPKTSNGVENTNQPLTNINTEINSTPAKNFNLREGRVRPIRPGASIGLLNVTTGNKSGTICCIVQDSLGQKYILSAEHVFRGKIGEPVIQPSISDGGGINDVVAKLTRYMPNRAGETGKAGGVIARILPNTDISTEIPGIGHIQGIASEANIGDLVRIAGSYSGIIECRVSSIYVDLKFNIGTTDKPVEVILTDMIYLDDVSSADDSGAPVLTKDNKLIGIVYGGSSTTTLVMPIAPLLEKLDVQLVK